MDNLVTLPNFTRMLTDLAQAVQEHNVDSINESLGKFEKALEERRSQGVNRDERDKKDWDDANVHEARVRMEKVDELRQEYKDNKALFDLAYQFQLSDAMAKYFGQMFDNLNDIRKNSVVSIEGNKKAWDNPDAHSANVKDEKSLEAMHEFRDLEAMYSFAESYDYKDGMKVVLGKMKKYGDKADELSLPVNKIDEEMENTGKHL